MRSEFIATLIATVSCGLSFLISCFVSCKQLLGPLLGMSNHHSTNYYDTVNEFTVSDQYKIHLGLKSNAQAKPKCYRRIIHLKCTLNHP